MSRLRIARLQGARPLALVLVAATAGCADTQPPTAARPGAAPSRAVSWGEIAALPVAPATARLAYGTAPQQFGDLRLPPTGTGPFPVAVVLHGGCWLNSYGLDQISQPAAELAKAGIATWTVEYRRIGDQGAGWTGTFTDVARSVDYVRTLAARYPLDTTRVILVGHSAGGHLALWAAARGPLPAGASTASPAGPTLRTRGVVSLAGIADLVGYAGSSGCNASVPRLMGGTPSQVPSRYRAASPLLRVPLGVPVRMVHGSADPIVPVAQSTTFAQRDSAAGDDARVRLAAGAGHFDLIAPSAPAWQTVMGAVRELLPTP
jgi:acetyl esterase/lipase